MVRAAVSARDPAADPAEVDRLLARIAQGPAGHLSVSVYETGRLVRLAPWVWGHQARIDYLMARQQRDGSWGGPGQYALAPTLSATEALLHLACAPDRPAIRAERGTDAADLLAAAAERGLEALGRLLGDSPRHLPGTVGADAVVRHLITEINQRLCRCDRPQAAHRRLRGHAPLPLPVVSQGQPGATLALRQQVPRPAPGLPSVTGHILEAAGGAARDSTGLAVEGVVGGSPAATAAWVAHSGNEHRDPHCMRWLHRLARRYGGPVPSLWPTAVYEQALVVAALARGGLTDAVPASLRAGLRRSITCGGIAPAPGLPRDCQATSTLLHALGALGEDAPLEVLQEFRTAAHFQRWPGEPAPSTVTNAHVLEALGCQVTLRPQRRPRYAPTIAAITQWLQNRQHPSGYWDDPWHTSPYYATYCSVMALSRYGGFACGGSPAGGDAAVTRAVRWIQTTQRPDGAWGRWTGTAEETAYALQTLLAAAHHASPGPLARGAAALRRLTGASRDHPPLWCGKDLYAPAAVIDAVVLAATHRLRIHSLCSGRATA
ncbi:prenyltransferase/squalene oxidase repeat-containing protein [Spirillospora sp. CA-255316]